MKHFYIPFVAFPLISITTTTVFASGGVQSDEEDFGLEQLAITVTAAPAPVGKQVEKDAGKVADAGSMTMKDFADWMVAEKYPNQTPPSHARTNSLEVPPDHHLKKPDEGKVSSGVGGASSDSAKEDS